MKQIRLLPIVILAAGALLLLKGFGIMTGGGYVLTGASAVQAAGAAPKKAGGEAATMSDGAATMSMPEEPTMVDESPTMEDDAPTLSLGGDGGGHGKPSGGHGETEPEGAEAAGHGDETADVHGEEESHGEEAADAHGGEADAHGGSDGNGEEDEASVRCPEDEQSVAFVSPDGGCLPPVNENGDAIAMEVDDHGNPVAIEADGMPGGSEASVLERLAERRDQLDTREAELEMRLALVEAAEQRIAERTAALEVLEARINAMVDEKRALEEAQFTALVSMYETMKPKDAAAIFDELEADVLLRVVRAINPRKMAPIMAKMNPTKAKDLTAGLAVDQVEPTIDLSGEDLASLPQIVGQ